MRMTKACEYGLQGVLHLAMQPAGKTTLLSEISKERVIPYSFLGKIFRHLVKAGIVKSLRGVHGGFVLGRSPKKITMKDVVESVEGDIAFSNCSSNTNGCERIAYCSMATSWRKAHQRALEVLENVTFETLAREEKKKAIQGKK
ncbi:MAG: Rrf2 family transcriptional regulator [Candidatus Omnitrophica bacterium]|nr:Rrf2 family transcriptional regulator [Candidatus Omnitrophota bacterium]